MCREKENCEERQLDGQRDTEDVPVQKKDYVKEKVYGCVERDVTM